MDQIRKQVDRARRRLWIELFLGPTGEVLVRRAAGGGDRRSPCRSWSRSRICPPQWARVVAGRRRGRGIACGACVDVAPRPQRARRGDGNRSPLRTEGARRQQPVAAAGSGRDARGPRAAGRRAAGGRPAGDRRAIPDSPRPRRVAAAGPGALALAPGRAGRQQDGAKQRRLRATTLDAQGARQRHERRSASGSRQHREEAAAEGARGSRGAAAGNGTEVEKLAAAEESRSQAGAGQAQRSGASSSKSAASGWAATTS